MFELNLIKYQFKNRSPSHFHPEFCVARLKYDFSEWYKNVTVDDDSDTVHGMMEYDLLALRR